MNRKFFVLIGAGLLMAGTAGAEAQGLGHTFLMRGQVVQVKDGEAVLCIGKADGAAPGQSLSVIRAESVPAPGAKGGISFRRRDVGTVTIAAIIDGVTARNAPPCTLEANGYRTYPTAEGADPFSAL